MTDRPPYLEKPTLKNFKWPYLYNDARQMHGHNGPPMRNAHRDLNDHLNFEQYLTNFWEKISNKAFNASLLLV